MNFKRIIISRTDSIGDVMLTLPMCGVIKKHFPDCEIIFLGRTYTRAVIECCRHVDHFENWDDWKDSAPVNQIEQLAKWKADVIIHVFPERKYYGWPNAPEYIIALRREEDCKRLRSAINWCFLRERIRRCMSHSSI